MKFSWENCKFLLKEKVKKTHKDDLFMLHIFIEKVLFSVLKLQVSQITSINSPPSKSSFMHVSDNDKTDPSNVSFMLL